MGLAYTYHSQQYMSPYPSAPATACDTSHSRQSHMRLPDGPAWRSGGEAARAGTGGGEERLLGPYRPCAAGCQDCRVSFSSDSSLILGLSQLGGRTLRPGVPGHRPRCGTGCSRHCCCLGLAAGRSPSPVPAARRALGRRGGEGGMGGGAGLLMRFEVVAWL